MSNVKSATDKEIASRWYLRQDSEEIGWFCGVCGMRDREWMPPAHYDDCMIARMVARHAEDKETIQDGDAETFQRLDACAKEIAALNEELRVHRMHVCPAPIGDHRRIVDGRVINDPPFGRKYRDADFD